MVVGDVRRRRPEHELELRARPGPRRPAGGWPPGRPWGPAPGGARAGPPGPGGNLVPSRGDGCRSRRCTSRACASARSTARCPAGSRVRPKSATRAGRSQASGSARSRRTRRQPLRGAGPPDPRAQAVPQLRLPDDVLAQRRPAAAQGVSRRPPPHHLRAQQRVAVVEVGEVADGREPAGPAGRIRTRRRAAEVDGQRVQPGLPEGLVDDREQRPAPRVGQPRVRVEGRARGRGDGVAHQPARRGERDVRADAVRPARTGAEPRREALGQPALHPPGRHGDHLGRERVPERIGEQVAERLDQAVGAFGAVDVQHRPTLGPRPVSSARAAGRRAARRAGTPPSPRTRGRRASRSSRARARRAGPGPRR